MLFGAKTHKYILNPTVDAIFVRTIEEKYNFKLTDDYFQFITQVGNGGAGLDHGIYAFERFLTKGTTEFYEKNLEEIRCNMSKPFNPTQILDSEVKDYLYSRHAYEENSENFFVFEKYSEEDKGDLACGDGFFVIGTHGCQWDFGIVVTGERRGQVFDTDSEGSYVFFENSFEKFYNEWLSNISNNEWLENKIT